MPTRVSDATRSTRSVPSPTIAVKASHVAAGLGTRNEVAPSRRADSTTQKTNSPSTPTGAEADAPAGAERAADPQEGVLAAPTRAARFAPDGPAP